MQKIKLILLMTGICVHSFFVKAESPTSKLATKKENLSKIQTVEAIYQEIDFKGNKKLDFDVFKQAYIGYLNLLEADAIPANKQILSVCDFSLSSNTKRLWIIDIEKKTLLFHSLVAHGQGTGEEFAKKFSDRENSHQSSLGFYITDDTYMGSNGYSLRLHGKDKGYNTKALQRAIVLHGAPYVSQQFIKGNSRLGRSWGCPAVPQQLAKPIINTIKGGSVLFVYYPSEEYAASSTWLAKVPAALQPTNHLNNSTDQELSKKALAQLESAEVTSQNQLPISPESDASYVEKKPTNAVYDGVQLATPPIQ